MFLNQIKTYLFQDAFGPKFYIRLEFCLYFHRIRDSGTVIRKGFSIGNLWIWEFDENVEDLCNSEFILRELVCTSKHGRFAREQHPSVSDSNPCTCAPKFTQPYLRAVK